MPEQAPTQTTTQPSGTPAEPTQQPQAGTPQASGTPAEPHEPTSPAGESLEDLKKVRAEAASLRKRLADYERREQDAKDAQLGDLDREKKAREKAEATIATLREQLVSNEIKLEAQALKFHDPSDAVDKIAAQVRDLEDPEERQKAIADKLKDLARNKPYLVASAADASSQQQQSQQQPHPTSGGSTNPGRGAAAGAPLTRESIAAMSREERMRRMPEINEWLQQQYRQSQVRH